jgi:hypothetical protein
MVVTDTAHLRNYQINGGKFVTFVAVLRHIIEYDE